MKKVATLILIFLLVSAPVFALELDLSVDEDIRKNYNPSKLENDVLPPLPKSQQGAASSVPSTSQPKSLPSSSSTYQKYPISTAASPSRYTVKIKKGTKFKVRSNQAVSDSTKRGARISFSSNQNVYSNNGILIPAGTVFRGEIIDSHNPQITGNGGLIVMIVDGITYKGSTSRIEAKITKANHKKIFINNIKGERGYLKGMASSIKPGKKFFNVMMRWTNKLSNLGILVILTPITVISGVVVYGVNVAGSPIFAIFSKGAKIYIPTGSEYEIKLMQDVYL